MDIAVSQLNCSRFDTEVEPYCFGDLSDADREQFELHLLGCAACWQEVRRLSDAVNILRTVPAVLNRARTSDVIGVLGMSGRLHKAFGGHLAFVVSSAVLHGLLYAASVWTELGYSYDRFGALAWTLLPIVLFVMGVTLAFGLWIEHRQAVASKDTGLMWASVLVIAVALQLVAVMFFVLPAEQTIQAAFETRSASAGYQKNVTNYFLPLLVFLLPTFHTVLALQRELQLGRHQSVLDLLAGTINAVSPRGVWLIRPWMLWLAFLVGVIVGIQGTNHMLDNLNPGPYANLYTAALHIRVALWFAIAVLSVVWYQRSLNEIKREALAGVRLMKAEPKH